MSYFELPMCKLNYLASIIQSTTKNHFGTTSELHICAMDISRSIAIEISVVIEAS